MRVVQALTYLLCTLTGLIAIALVLAFSLDFGRFKPQAESLLTEILGRTFVIEGPLHLTLDLDQGIKLSAVDVRLADSHSHADSNLVSLRSIDVAIDLRSLLHQPVVIDKLRVDGLRVNLEQGADGKNNWTLPSDKGSLPASESEGKRFKLPVLPTDVRLTDTAITYTRPSRPQPLRVTAETISEAVLADGGMRLNMEGEINDTGFDIEISSTQFSALISMLDVELGLKGHLGEILFDGELAVADLQAPRRPTARLNLTGPDIEYLLDILELEHSTSGPLSLAMEFAPQEENMGLSLQGVFGEFIFAANGSFLDLQHLETFKISAKAHGPNIGRVAGLFGVEHVPHDPFSLSARVVRADRNFSIDDTVLTVGQARLVLDGLFADFPSLNDARATAQLDIPDIGHFSKLLRIPGALDGPLLLNASLAAASAGNDTRVEASASSNDITLQVDGNIVDAEDYAGSHVQIALNGPTLQTITTAIGLELTPNVPFALQANVDRIPGGMALPEVRVEVGADQLTLRGSVADQPMLGETDLTVELGGPNIAETLNAFGISATELPPKPYQLNGRLQTAPEHLIVQEATATIGKERMVIDGIIGSDPLSAKTRLAFELTSPALKPALDSYGIAVEQLPESDLSAKGSIQGGVGFFSLQEVIVMYAGATAQIEGRVTNSPALDGTALQLALSGPNLAHLLPPNERLKRLAKPFTLDAAIRIEDKLLIIEGADIRIDQTQLQLDSQVGLDPLLEHGSLELTGNSVDVLALTSELDEISVSDRLPLKLQGRVTWVQNQWSIKALNLYVGKSQLTVDGTLKGPPDFGKTNLQVDGKIPSLSGFSLLAGRELPDIPAHMNFSLIGNGDVIRLKGLSVIVGDSDLSGELSLRSKDIPELTTSFTSKRMNLTPFLAKAAEAKPDQDATVIEAPRPADKHRKVIPDTPVSTEVLKTFVAQANVRIEELAIDARTFQDVELGGSVAEGALIIDKLGLKGSQGGYLEGKLALRPSPHGTELRVRMKGDSLSLPLRAETEEELQNLPRLKLNLALISEGATVRALAGAANGYLRVESGQGQIKAGALRMLTNDFLDQLISSVNPFAVDDPYTEIHCATVLTAVEAGQVVGEPIFVLNGSRVNIFANAHTDLRTEKLDVHFNTVPQKGLGISMTTLINPYIMVTGTLAQPSLTLDAESTLIQGGAALVTGGLSILATSIKDRYLSPKDPCGHAYIEADEGQRALEAKYAPGTKKN
ncbi:MAG: AsmA family protein [Halioglobus sp.]